MNKVGKSFGILLASALATGVAHAGKGQTFTAHMDGDSNVPPTDTKAQAQLILKVKSTGSIAFKLIASSVDDFTVSHIHCGIEGQNGKPGITLVKLEPATSVNGILEGTIAAPDANNECGWVTNKDVVTAIKAGGAYVNVHTKSAPAGVIRGQIR